MFVIVISFCHGLYTVSDLGLFMYQKEVFGLSPETITLIKGVVNLPWSIKPIFGYAFDHLMRRISQTKYIVFVSTLTRFTTFFLMAKFDLPIYVFYGLLLLNSVPYVLENIIAEYTLVCLTKATSSKQRGTRNQMPIYFGFRACGCLVGGFYGGRIIESFGNQASFLACSLIPFVLLAGACLYKEPRRSTSTSTCKSTSTSAPPPLKKSIRSELGIMKNLLMQDNVLQLVMFIFLINLTPNFDSLNTFYLTDHLKFSTEDLANFSAFATCCYILGLLLYYYKLQAIDPKNFYITTNFVLWVINISFLLVVLDILETWGFSVKVFCLLSQGAGSFVAELNFMPILAIWCRLCPQNLEGTSITLFTGLLNLSTYSSLYFGSFLLWMIKITKTEYHRMWEAVVVQQSYLLVMILGILFIDFPDTSKEHVYVNVEEEKINVSHSWESVQSKDPRIDSN